MPDTPEHDDHASEDFSFDRSELDAMRADTAVFMRQRLVMWGIRWTIGFGLIALVVWYNPDLTWLWWVGGAVALTSLAFLIVGQKLMQSRINKTESRIQQAESDIRAHESDRDAE